MLASVRTMSKHIKIPFIKRKLRDSSEMQQTRPLSYAYVAVKSVKVNPRSGSSHDKNSGQVNQNLQGPPGRDDRKNDQPHTSVEQRKSSSSDRNRTQGHQGLNLTQNQQSFDNSAKQRNNQSWNSNQTGNRSRKFGNKGRGRCESSQTSQVNNQNRIQDYGKSNSSDFVYQDPEFSVNHRQESETVHYQSSTENLAQRLSDKYSSTVATSDRMARALMQAMEEQMERTTFYDVVITVKQRAFKCHRFQLSACSKFFRAMFSSGMKEDLAKTVDIKDIEPDIFSLVIECIYKAKYVINAENVASLWHAANQLQIDVLTESCEIFLAENLSKYNCVELYLNAKLLDSKMILKLSWELIVKEFEYLRKTETILNLDCDDMMKLLADDALVVPSEDVLIDVIIRWVNFILEPITVNNEENRMTAETSTAHLTTHKELTSSVANTKYVLKDVILRWVNFILGRKTVNNEENRMTAETSTAHLTTHTKLTSPVANTKENVENMQEQNISALKEQFVCENEQRKKGTNFREQFLPSLLSAAKICLVSSTRLQSLIERKLIFENQKALAVVMRGLRYHLQPGKRHDYCPPSAIHRSSSELKNVVMFIFVHNAQLQMSCRTMDGICFSLAAPVNHLAQCKAVSYGNDVYALPTNGYQYAFKYDSRTNTWRQIVSEINVPRQNTSIVVLDHYIYAVGGDNCRVIERFNAEAEQSVPGSGKWANIGELTHAVTNTVVTTLGNNIFVFGNTSDNIASITIQSFDTQTMTTHISLKEMLGSSKNIITFKYEDSIFLLQETGALWKMAASDECDFSLKLLGVVWDFPLELSAATICNNELLVFVKSIDPQMPCEWDTVVYPEFKHVKIIHREVNCILNNVIPKALLTVKEV